METKTITMDAIADKDSLVDTQENTQNSESVRSQGVESQPLVEKEPWGRLNKKRALCRRLGMTTAKQTVLFNYKGREHEFFDIRGPEFHFGRDPLKCEYVVGKQDGIDLKSWNRISKVHFTLSKDMSWEESPVLIKDCSRNGTYLNGELIGQNQTRIIKTGDVISIVNDDLKIFDFKDLTLRTRVDLPKELQSEYFIAEKLGAGAFGEVYKLLDRKLSPYAVKYIKGNSMLAQENDQVTDNEISIMKKVRHVCIIQTIDIMKVDMGGACLILEYMEGGDLLNRIVSSPHRRLTEEQSRFVFFQVTEAVRYLHSKGITHRDIKPDNVLLKDTDEYTLVKLTDFGLSKIITEGTVMKSLIGTPNFVAPEILRSEVSKYTSKVDVWSMGVCLFAMISGTLPFSEDYGDIHKQIIAGTFKFIGNSWKEVSQDARRLIRQMLEVKPERRIKVGEILETNWMDDKYEGIMKAKKIMEQYGGNMNHLRSDLQAVQIGKENEFVRPEPPAKRVRYNF